MTELGALVRALDELQGRITLDKRHCYRMNKQIVPGTTTIIKTLDAPALDAWKVRVQVEGTARAAYANPPVSGEEPESYVSRLLEIAKAEFEHERIANAAADIGTQVHALIEHEINTQLGKPAVSPEVGDHALFIFAGWKEWAANVGLRPLASESRVCWPVTANEYLRPEYCGTFDILCTFDRGLYKSRLAVIDAKPNARIYPERRLQLSAYTTPVKDLSGEDVLGMIVSMPREGGETEMVSVDLDDEDFEAFRRCVALYNWQKAKAKAARDAKKEVA